MKVKHISFSLVSPIFLMTLFSFFLFSGCSGDQGNKNLSDQANENTEGTEMNGTQTNSSATFLSIQRPFKTIDKNETTEGIHIENPTKASSHTTLSGTVINIPANAFVDENGKSIISPVDIKFQEIKTVAEIISSGIPMKMIDENGYTQWMQTAGMFDIQGYQDDKPIQIAEGKNIEIDYVSDVEGEYDFWYFDKEKGNWVNQGTTTAVATKEGNATQEENAEINRLQALTETMPTKPKVDNANKLLFRDLDLKECPKLKDVKEVVLTYAGKDEKKAPKNNDWINQPRIWHKKILKPIKGSNKYQLTLLGDTIYQIDVKLALSALEIQRKSAGYEKRLAAYKENMQALRNKEKNLTRKDIFRRLVSVGAFGVYNYDILWKRKDAIALNADFDFEEISNEAKRTITVYLITDDGDMVIGLPSAAWNSFAFPPAKKNKLLAILPNNKVAFFKTSDFDKEKPKMVKARNSNYTFAMQSDPMTINSMKDFQNLLAKVDN